MSKRTKIIALIIVVLVVVIATIHWMWRNQFFADVEIGANTGPIQIGFIAPLTGDAASYGVPMKNITALAVKEINATGGINGRPIEVIYKDDKCNGKDAANAIQNLITNNDIHVVIGSACSGATLAAVPIAAASKVVMLSPAASSPELTSVSSYFFRDYPSDATQGQVLADLAFQQKHWHTVAFIQEQLDYPLGIYNAFSARFQQLGGTVIKEEFPTGQDDLHDQLTKLKSQTPDALFIDTQTPAAAEKIVAQLKDINWHPPLLLSDIIAGDATTIAQKAHAFEGALAAEFSVDPANEKFLHLEAAYKDAYGVDLPFPSYAQSEYDAVYLLRDALMAVGNNGEKIATWSRTVTNWQGASGAITINSDGDREGGHVPKIIKNGKDVPYQQ